MDKHHRTLCHQDRFIEILSEVLNPSGTVRFCSEEVYKNAVGRPRQNGCIWLLLIFYSTQNCNGSSTRKVTFKHTASYETGATDFTVKLPKRCIGSRAPHHTTVLQKLHDKTPKASLHERLIMKKSPGLPQDISCLWKAALETERRCLSKIILA